MNTRLRLSAALAFALLAAACTDDRQIGGNGGGGAGGHTTCTSTMTTTTSTTSEDLTCEAGGSSNLPGVHIEITSTSCVLSRSDPAPLLVFNYNLVVDADLPGVTPARQDAGGCGQPEASGLIVSEKLFGGDEMYCLCDVGICPATPLPAVTLKAGVYPGTLTWDGNNWHGPSDTNNDPGPLFAVGDYTFQVSAKGTVAAPGGDTPFEVLGTTTVHVVP